MTADQEREETGPLPLSDYDQLSAGELEHRIRSLGREALQTLLDHEQHHADRAAVELMLRNRIEQLDEGAEPSSGGFAPPPATANAPPAGSPISPSRATEPRHSPPHGTPQHSGKGDRMGPATGPA